MFAISFQAVSKRFALAQQRPRAVLDLLRPGARTGPGEFWALRDVSFEIAAGETFGLIGATGSGKSTVLKLISAIMRPTTGRVRVEGSVSAMIELGAGFHPDFSGRDNVFLYGSILGLSRSSLRGAFDEIVDFAELTAFIDSPIKHYSSGMQMRLAFAIAAQVEPSILLIDEVLAVGDLSFQQKCLARIADLSRAGVTVVFVSHALDTVRTLCDRVAWLDHGQLRRLGGPEDVVAAYVKSTGNASSPIGLQ